MNQKDQKQKSSSSKGTEYVFLKDWLAQYHPVSREAAAAFRHLALHCANNGATPETQLAQGVELDLVACRDERGGDRIAFRKRYLKALWRRLEKLQFITRADEVEPTLLLLYKILQRLSVPNALRLRTLD